VSTTGDTPRVLYVFGAGGQGREAAWFARCRWSDSLQVRFVVDDPRFLPADGAPEVTLLENVRPHDGDRWVAAVGDIAGRRKAVHSLAATGMAPAQVVHPSVDLSGVERLGTDVVVGPGVVLSVGVVVHDHVHVNVGTTVSHDAILGQYATLSPGVHVAGWVDIRPGAFLGTGASVVNGSPGRRLVIGEGAVVAAGAVVLDDVPAGSMYAGVPARRKR
jgi:sugar O-acyltransferase (sialic acid O-acetyltransferase NeuD family)